MATTYYLTKTNSDLSGGADFSYKLLTTTDTTATLAVSVAKSATETSYAWTEPGIPGSFGGTGAQNYTVQVRVTSNNANITLTVSVSRVNSSGSVQTGPVQVGSPTTLSANQNYTFGATSCNLGTFASGDRLRIEYKFVNGKSSAQSVTIGQNTSSDYASAPWTIANATATPSGVSSSASVGTASETGTAEKTASGVSATASVGTATESAGATKAADGVSATAGVGTPSGTGGATGTPTGQQVESGVGTPDGTGTADYSAQGVTSQSVVGTVSPDGEGIAEPDGVEAAASVGTAVAEGTEGSGDSEALPLGVEAVASVGEVDAVGEGEEEEEVPSGGWERWTSRHHPVDVAEERPVDASVKARGVSAKASIGRASGSGSGVVSPHGVGAIFHVGGLTASVSVEAIARNEGLNAGAGVVTAKGIRNPTDEELLVVLSAA